MRDEGVEGLWGTQRLFLTWEHQRETEAPGDSPVRMFLDTVSFLWGSCQKSWEKCLCGWVILVLNLGLPA